jgi:hypothetical protein
MMNNVPSNRMQVQSTGSPYKKETLRPVENFPLEVVNLLNVCARIEARRQAKLRHEQKEVG